MSGYGGAQISQVLEMFAAETLLAEVSMQNASDLPVELCRIQMHWDINVCVRLNLRRQHKKHLHRISGTGRNIPLTGYIKRHLSAHLAAEFESLNLDL